MKRLYAYLATGLCLALCCAIVCGCAGRARELSAPEGAPEPLSHIERESEGLAALQDGAEKFAARFAAAAYAERAGEGNLAVAPLSVYMALALEAECAAGETKAELLRALNTDERTLRENFGLLYRSVFTDRSTRKALLSNSVWLAEGLPVQQACADLLAEEYFCHSFLTDFASDNEGANKAVQKFVQQQTNGLIDRNFELPSSTYFAVINTLYLKELWNAAGKDLALTDETYAFLQADGTAFETKLMRGLYAEGRPQSGEHFTYFFAGTHGGSRLLFLLPDEGYAVRDILTEENIAAAAAREDYGSFSEDRTTLYRTRCLFPAFEASYDADVRGLLRENFGIQALFDDAVCDLSALLGGASTEDAPYACTQIRHATELTVDEGGIEGAAATIAANGATSAAPEVVSLDFIVDRAFGFVLLDNKGTTLFSGAVERLH